MMMCHSERSITMNSSSIVTFLASIVLTLATSSLDAADAPAKSPSTAPAATQPAPQVMTVDQLKKLLADDPKDVVLLDVRTDDEFAAGHLKDAVHINVQAPDFEKKAGELDRDKTYIVYCRTGRRGDLACRKLDTLKFPADKHYNLKGGITAWQAAGNAVEK